MKCPYCTSLIEDESLVCKVCHRDIYLFKPLTETIRSLQEKLSAQEDREQLHKRIQELEYLLEVAHQKLNAKASTWREFLIDLAQFVLIPLMLLLLGHALITVVYDLPLIYLRLVSIALPLPFGYWLFKGRGRSLLPWFISAALLAAVSVVGMSAITAWVDHVPVMPQSMLEWREFMEYASSIAFSFLTGMLLGGIAYHRIHRPKNAGSPFLKLLVMQFSEGKLSPDAIQQIIKKLEGFGSTALALGATATSIYTGLKVLL
jgi:hypothetical protein